MTEAVCINRCGQERLRAGGSAIGVVHAERRDSPNQSIRPAGRTVRATGCNETSLKSGRDQEVGTDEAGWIGDEAMSAERGWIGDPQPSVEWRDSQLLPAG
jgi:hypothetical protein